MAISLIILGIIVVIVAYIIGKVSGIPDCFPYQPICNYPYSCSCPKCCRDYVNITTTKINENMAYQRGKYEGELEAMEHFRFRPKEYKEQELLERLKTALKPLESFKKDFGIE